jgi:hypothetical protein
MTITFLQFRIKISLVLVFKKPTIETIPILKLFILGDRSEKFTTTKILKLFILGDRSEKFTTTKKKKPLRPTVSKLTKSHNSKTKLPWK